MGLQIAQQLDDAPLELTHAALLGRVLGVRGDFDRGRAMFDAHAHRIEAAGSDAAARDFLMHRAVVLDQASRRDEAVTAGLAALKLADYVVTEAGFGADLGAEKFVDIKCRKSGLRPSASALKLVMMRCRRTGLATARMSSQET